MKHIKYKALYTILLRIFSYASATTTSYRMSVYLEWHTILSIDVAHTYRYVIRSAVSSLVSHDNGMLAKEKTNCKNIEN